MIHEEFKRKYWKKTQLNDSSEQKLRFPMYFYNNLHPIVLMIRSIIMVTLIFNMYVDNVSPQKTLAKPLQKTEKKSLKAFIKRIEAPQRSVKIKN